MSVPYRNRTYNRVLGGPRYIHLTKGTNAVFSGFSALLATVAISMNPITFMMNFYFLVSTSFPFLYWNRTLTFTLLLPLGFNHTYTLGGGRSILLSYSNIRMQLSCIQLLYLHGDLCSLRHVECLMTFYHITQQKTILI